MEQSCYICDKISDKVHTIPHPQWPKYTVFVCDDTKTCRERLEARESLKNSYWSNYENN